MIESIIIGIAVGVSVMLITAGVNRAGIKTRNDLIVEKLEKLENGHAITMQVLLPLVLAVKGDKPNGEVDRALHLLNDYLIKK